MLCKTNAVNDESVKTASIDDENLDETQAKDECEDADMMANFWRLGLVFLAAAAMAACGQDDLTKLLEKHSEIIDLSHPLAGDSPHWPAEGYYGLRIDTLATLERNGVLSLAFHFPEHYGTHVDAPNHFAAGQIPVDEIKSENLFGPMVVLDISETAAKNPDYLLEKEDIVRWENIYGTIPDGAIVFINTGWARRWNNAKAYSNADKNSVMHFPAYGKPPRDFLSTNAA